MTEGKKQQSGFSLASLLGGLAVIGVIMAAVANIIQSMARNQEDLDALMQASTLRSNLQAVIAQPQACSALLDKDKKVNLQAALSSEGIALRMNMPDGQVVYEGEQLKGLPLQIKKFRLLEVTGSPSRLVGKLVLGLERKDRDTVFKEQPIGMMQISLNSRRQIQACESHKGKSSESLADIREKFGR